VKECNEGKGERVKGWTWTDRYQVYTMHCMKYEQHKARLLEEKAVLMEELSRLGIRVSGDNWEATEASQSDVGEDLGENKAEESEMADQIEMFEERTAEERALNVRYLEVITALSRLDGGSYGYCEAGGERHEIEEERLLANPAAATCVGHMERQN